MFPGDGQGSADGQFRSDQQTGDAEYEKQKIHVLSSFRVSSYPAAPIMNNRAREMRERGCGSERARPSGRARPDHWAAG